MTQGKDKMLPDRQPIIQRYLDEIEPGWIVKKPLGAGDIDQRCILQKPSEYKEAYADLPVRWFVDGRTDLIKREMRKALAAAVIK